MDQNSKKYKNKFLTIIEKVKINKAVNSVLKLMFSVFKKFKSFKILHLMNCLLLFLKKDKTFQN